MEQSADSLAHHAREGIRPPGNRLPFLGALRAFRRDQDGAAAVEFALVSAVLLPMLFALIAFSTTLFAMNAMQTGTAEAARRMAVNEASYALGTTACSAATTAGTTQYIACRLMPLWGTYSVTIALDCTARDVTVSMTNNTSVALGDVYRIITGTSFTTSAITRWEKTACP